MRFSVSRLRDLLGVIVFGKSGVQNGFDEVSNALDEKNYNNKKHVRLSQLRGVGVKMGGCHTLKCFFFKTLINCSKKYCSSLSDVY